VVGAPGDAEPGGRADTSGGVSDRALRSLARLRDAHGEALGESGQEPTHGELAARTGLTREQVDDLMATERPPGRSRSRSPGRTASSASSATSWSIRSPRASTSACWPALELEELHALLAGLSQRERDVLRARYGLDGEEQSLREVGRRLGAMAAPAVLDLSQPTVTTVETAAGASSSSPAWVTDPLAPPTLLQGR
jgi:DNA-directed RNA polymerase specialized sigma subunit